jgi:DNA invertase Pin-like site-specific DNA recombinase
MATWGYVRVSTDNQTNENQKLAILQYGNQKRLKIDHWIETKTSSRRSTKERRIDELVSQVQEGDVLLVAELSRLGRSVGQIAMLVDELIRKKVKVICLKENIILNGKADIQTKVMITMFSLFAEIERDLISERTKEGLARARAEGKLLGRPKGTIGKSKLDGKEKEIREYLKKRVNRANIARIYGVSFPTLENFLKTRNLKQHLQVQKRGGVI